MVLRRFYPLHPGGAIFSEQYFLYDFDKSPAENRADNADDPMLGDVVGTLVYPPMEDKKPPDNLTQPVKGISTAWKDFELAKPQKHAVPARRPALIKVPKPK
jgi:hypothetical protein